MVRENATTAQDQEEFKKKYDELKTQYDGLKDSLDKAISDKAYKQAQKIKMKAYMQEIKKADTYLPEWSDEIWMTMVESGTVNRTAQSHSSSQAVLRLLYKIHSKGLQVEALFTKKLIAT